MFKRHVSFLYMDHKKISYKSVSRKFIISISTISLFKIG
jgi:hypothetical protein